ncbi:MAG: SIS domain-containing protein, partial [Desulfobacteraceae bacterium]
MNHIKNCLNIILKKKKGIDFNSLISALSSKIRRYLYTGVCFGRYPGNAPSPSLIFFPCQTNFLCCGLAGIVSFKKEEKPAEKIDLAFIEEKIREIEARSFLFCIKNNYSIDDSYLCGKKVIESILQNVRELKRDERFFSIYAVKEAQEKLESLSKRINGIIDSESKILSEKMGQLEPSSVDVMSGRIEILKDVSWCLSNEIILNISKIKELIGASDNSPSFTTVTTYKNINAVLNSIDRLEVRGRDSAGISLMFVMDDKKYADFEKSVKDENLADALKERTCGDILLNGGITINRMKEKNGDSLASIAFVYKVAAEIGSLGDNIAFLRSQIKSDRILRIVSSFPNLYHTVSSHTRWASVGAITEANCHPVDGRTQGACVQTDGIIHVCLNGDIDNYLELKKEYESGGNLIHTDVTTDTKIIPLQIEKYINMGFEVEEAFRLAVNDFEGSHAISMHTDLDPGKFFLAQRGSGQAVFVGIGKDHYIPASEVYGLIEETPHYLKMEGEKIIEGEKGSVQGQIFILNQKSGGGISGIKAMFYDNTPVQLQEKDIKHTDITSRDIDRQNFPHYFLKEISESPASVEKTLQNRWKTGRDGKILSVFLSEKEFPESLKSAFRENGIRRIYFIGQGTAGVAGLVCSDILNYYLNDTSINIGAYKASELSGFRIDGNENPVGMSDTLVIAITQSGTTTDTNRAVEMVKKRGAHTIAIVNRRDSDITFKVDGVIYTSSGRDIEMSVASTKAFYCQIVAGAVLSLFIAGLLKRKNEEFIS